MKRKYDTARYKSSLELLRSYFPGCAVTADLIVGFPGETDDEFAETMSFIESCGFFSMHIFPYSVRSGTSAAEMPDQIPKDIKKKRAKEAGAIARRIKKEEDGISYGHAPNYCETAAPGEGLRGKCVNVIVKYEKNGVLFGELCL